jgi:hypothetical protein
VKRPSEISLRLRFSTQQNQGERLLPGNLGGEADRLVLAGFGLIVDGLNPPSPASPAPIGRTGPESDSL